MANEQPFRVIYEAEWNDIVCVDYPLTPEVYVRESIQPLVNTHVDALFYNLCSSDAYCCELENGEILCDAFPTMDAAWVWRYRENVKKMVEAGANPPDIAVEYVRDVDSEDDVAGLHLSAEAVPEAPSTWRLAAKRGDAGVTVAGAASSAAPARAPPPVRAPVAGSMWDFIARGK